MAFRTGAWSRRALAEEGAKARAAEHRAAVQKAIRALRAAVASSDSGTVRKVGLDLARLGGASAMKEVLDFVARVPDSDDALYWALLGTAASFVDRAGLEALGKTIRANAEKPLARDLLYALGANPSPNCVVALAPILDGGPTDLRILAVSKLARIYTPAAVDALIAVLVREEKSGRGEPGPVALIAADGLAAITGQKFGTGSVNWKGWWEKNRNKPLRAPGEAYAGTETGTAVDSLRLDRLRREGLVGLEKAPPQTIVVLSAVYTKRLQRDLNNDKVETVLERMRIPHTVVRREDFGTYDLSKACALIINCAQFHEFCICPDCKPGGDKTNRLYRCTGCNKHIPFSAKLSDPEIRKIVNFVQRGGHLFCEDWVVKEVVERAFPDFVSAGAVLKEDRVDVVPARGMASHPYLRGIYSPRAVGRRALPWQEDAEESGEISASEEEENVGRTAVVGGGDFELLEGEGVRVQHTWQIDDESWAIKVAGSGKVLPLLVSGKLQKVAEGQGIVALAFRPMKGQSAAVSGDGRAAPGTPGVVLLVLSHFGKQQSVEDEYSIQNLLLNFLLDAHASSSRNSKR